MNVAEINALFERQARRSFGIVPHFIRGFRPEGGGGPLLVYLPKLEMPEDRTVITFLGRETGRPHGVWLAGARQVGEHVEADVNDPGWLAHQPADHGLIHIRVEPVTLALGRELGLDGADDTPDDLELRWLQDLGP